MPAVMPNPTTRDAITAARGLIRMAPNLDDGAYISTRHLDALVGHIDRLTQALTEAEEVASTPLGEVEYITQPELFTMPLPAVGEGFSVSISRFSIEAVAAVEEKLDAMAKEEGEGDAMEAVIDSDLRDLKVEARDIVRRAGNALDRRQVRNGLDAYFFTAARAFASKVLDL